MIFLYFSDLSSDRNTNFSHITSNETETPKWVANDIRYVELYKWFTSEKPICKPSDDRADRKIYADRIAHHLQKKNTRNHICLIGPFGIGKTSIWEMARQSLNDKNSIFVKVDGWGRPEKSCAAQILDEIIHALSDYVDCAAIKDTPKEYVDALSGADFTGASSIANILSFHNRKSPKELIEKIDNILICIGKRIVVILEDFDRNDDSNKAINQIASLLDRLRELKSIDFIICVGPDEKSSILSRISTHREDIISFDSYQSIQALIDLMKCYASHMDVELIISSNDESIDFAKAVNGLIKTPRELKYILRRSLSAWESLAGEVNFYDLIIINVLRYSAPESIDFIVKKIEYFKNGIEDIKLKDEFLKKIDINNTEAMHSLIKTLFPKWNSAVAGSLLRSSFQRLNGQYGHTYLNKILYESPLREPSDQELIKNLIVLSNDGGSLLTDKSAILRKIALSDDLTHKFFEICHISINSDRNKYISGLSFYRFILEKYNTRGNHYDSSILYLIKEYNLPEYFFELIKLMLQKDIEAPFILSNSVTHNNSHFIGIFCDVYLSGDLSNIDLKVTAFKDSLKNSDFDTLAVIYKSLLLLSEKYLKNYIYLLIETFKISPSLLVMSITNILSDINSPPNALHQKYELWTNYTSDLRNAIDSNLSKISEEDLKNININIKALLDYKHDQQ